MIKQKSLIGMELDSIERTIESSQLIRLYRAFYQPNSYGKAKGADVLKNEPYNHIPSFLLGNLVNLPMIYKALGLNIKNVLLSRETIMNQLPLAVGDAVTVRTFLKDAYEQQASGNPIGFVILETIGSLKDDLAFYCERVIAVRGGFNRAASNGLQKVHSG